MTLFVKTRNGPFPLPILAIELPIAAVATRW
jgi:hypothetical protein